MHMRFLPLVRPLWILECEMSAEFSDELGPGGKMWLSHALRMSWPKWQLSPGHTWEDNMCDTYRQIYNWYLMWMVRFSKASIQVQTQHVTSRLWYTSAIFSPVQQGCASPISIIGCLRDAWHQAPGWIRNAKTTSKPEEHHQLPTGSASGFKK